MNTPKGTSLPPPKPSKTETSIISLRTRMLDLHARLAELRDTSAMLRDNIGPARTHTWQKYLSQFDTLSKLMTQLTHELDASHQNGLEHFVTVPKGEALKLRENGAVDVVPDLLRTRLDVDLEREYEGMKGGVYVGGVEAYNEFVEGCVDVVVEGRESGFEGGEEGGEEGGVVAEGVLAAIATGVGLRR